jgi:hypothetical protein
MGNFFSGLIFMFSLFFMLSCNYLPDALTGASKPMVLDGNSLFHQTETISLEVGELLIGGEVKHPGKVNLDDFYQREVMVKEAFYDHEKGIDFVGAYRYRGYSLFDLLHPFNYQKKNADEFKPAIDLYLVIENDQGKSVSFSWSEIFHTNIPHQVLIATEMAPIVPYRKDVDYPAGKSWRLVCGNDLFAYRMLDNPVRITVRSFDEKTYPIQRNLEQMHSPGISVVFEDGKSFRLDQNRDSSVYKKYFSSFYGMGMGYHETKFFSGPLLNELLEDKISLFDADWISNGLICFAGLDGYRAIFSFSELFNRTDQVSPILAVPENPQDGGFYRIFHPAEFYADRSVKSVQEMYFFKP